MIINVGNFERVHIEEGSYRATLAEIRQGQIPSFDDPAQKQDVLWWSFTIDGEDVAIDGMTTLATGAKSKMRAWVKALGSELASGSFDLASLYGRACLVAVEDKSHNGALYSRIADVLALPVAKGKAKTAPVVAAVEEEIL